MNFSYAFRGAVITLMLLFTTAVGAQASSIIGAGSLARDCYQASQVAARTGFSSREDLEICNQAVIFGGLNSRDSVATYVNRGIVKVALNDIKGGVADYEKAMKLMPADSAEAYVNRGNLWVMAKQYDRAVVDYEKALELDLSKSHIAFLNLGLAYEYLKDYAKAKQYYEQALAVIPEWPTATEKLVRVNKKLAVAE